METGDATPIGEYGVVGDLRSLALIGADASVDWMCWPRFDSPSIFGQLLDDDGGHWRIAPDGSPRQRQLYLPNTNVLLTRYQHDQGMVEVQDFMLVDGKHALVRQVSGIRGTTRMRSELTHRPNYGRDTPSVSNGEQGFDLDNGEARLVYQSSVPSQLIDGSIVSDFEVKEDDRIVFVLGDPVDIDAVDVADTAEFWRSWLAQSDYQGRWREVVDRSALTLKLLTHAESGAMIAAGTTSLPETVGGERNWDYRYVWIRDAAFTLYAFLELGFINEAKAFTKWLTARMKEGLDSPTQDGPLSPLYDIDGNSQLDESALSHWSGYLGSSPVRIGNGASDQLQLDIYGELIDSLYLADRNSPLSLDVWEQVTRIVDWVCENWERPDDGMWEVRSGRQRFTSSALMCWVAVERAIRMATFRGRPADLPRWRTVRDEIHTAICKRGWNEEISSFTQTFDGDALDASLLLMPLVKFIAPDDPKWASTFEAIRTTLVHDVLVDRYDNSASDDGLDGDDGSFGICSFWFVENLARSGEVDKARLLFEKMLTYAGPLGLFSEVISPNGSQLGNYPQAFTHLSLISAAVHLDQLLD